MEDLSSRQQEEAKKERVDYEQVDTGLINDARNKRKRQRKHLDDKNIAEDREEDEDDFRMNLEVADKKFRVKRKKKYMFNDAGIKIEPFKMDDEMVERHGEMIIMKERAVDSDNESDPWLESIKEQQDQLLREKAKKQVDSDESESSDDEGKSDNQNEDNLLQQESLKVDLGELIELKSKLITFLNPKENVQKALKRLKANSSADSSHKIKTKKKNVRKRQKVNEEDNEQHHPDSVNEEQFNQLMEIANKLFELKYLDVYQDDKEAIEFEINQNKIIKQREDKRKEMNKNGWVYKIEVLDGSSDPQQFGPFSSDKLEEWKKQGFFKENENQVVAFKRFSDINKEDVEWKFIDEISKF
jgi:hypothetical protein